MSFVTVQTTKSNLVSICTGWKSAFAWPSVWLKCERKKTFLSLWVCREERGVTWKPMWDRWGLQHKCYFSHISSDGVAVVFLRQSAAGKPANLKEKFLTATDFRRAGTFIFCSVRSGRCIQLLCNSLKLLPEAFQKVKNEKKNTLSKAGALKKLSHFESRGCLQHSASVSDQKTVEPPGTTWSWEFFFFLFFLPRSSAHPAGVCWVIRWFVPNGFFQWFHCKALCKCSPFTTYSMFLWRASFTAFQQI